MWTLRSHGLWEGNHILRVALAPLGFSSQASSEPKSWVCLGCSASPVGQCTPAVGPELPAPLPAAPAPQSWGASVVPPPAAWAWVRKSAVKFELGLVSFSI